MSSTSSKLKGSVRTCTLSCGKSRGAFFLAGFGSETFVEWRGQNAAPHHLGLKGTNLGPSLCNQTIGSKSAPISLRTLPLQNIFFNLSRQVILARWHCLATTPSQIFALSY